MPNSFSEIKYEMPSEQLHEELSDENSQELAHEMKVRVRKFLSGRPLEKGQRPFIGTGSARVRLMVHKARILMSRHKVVDTESFRQVIEQCIPESVRELNLDDELLDEAEQVLNEWTTTSPIHYRSVWSSISEIPPRANRFSEESAKLAMTSLLCEVCLESSHFPLEQSHLEHKMEPPTKEELDRIRKERPSLMCSCCSIVVHVDCMKCSSSRFEFEGRAILEYIPEKGAD